jgi:uncharacterized protein (TIGR04255 family)
MKLETTEKFPHLRKAPIVEAVIDFRAKPTVQCEQKQFETYFKAEFKDFPAVQVHDQVNYHLKPGAVEAPELAKATSSWRGLAFHSSDKLKIVQCQLDGFSFSRLAPYEHWEAFEGEALQLWLKYSILTKPVEIERIGVRFINRIEIDSKGGELSNYLVNAPRSWDSFPVPFAGFMHSDTFSVPDTNYLIHVIRALQPGDAISVKPAIILDTDIFTQTPQKIGEELVRSKLAEIRWLKNKIFFASLAPGLLESLK